MAPKWAKTGFCQQNQIGESAALARDAGSGVIRFSAFLGLKEAFRKKQTENAPQ